MVEGSGKLIKFLMIFINFVLLIAGFVILGTGVYTYIDKTPFEYLIGSNRYIISVSLLFIVIGILTAFISLIGFCGAYKERRCLLIIYFTFIFIIFCLIIASVVLAYLFRTEVDEKMATEMYASIKKYKEAAAYTDSWDVVQRTFKCCGVSGPSNLPPWTSWKNNNEKNFNDSSELVPMSCCVTEASDCNKAPKVPDSIFKEDCFDKMKNYIKDNSLVLGIISIVVAILLLISMTLSCSLFCMIKN